MPGTVVVRNVAEGRPSVPWHPPLRLPVLLPYEVSSVRPPALLSFCVGRNSFCNLKHFEPPLAACFVDLLFAACIYTSGEAFSVGSWDRNANSFQQAHRPSHTTRSTHVRLCVNGALSPKSTLYLLHAYV